MIANDLKKGSTLVYEGEIYEVVDYQHVKPGKGGAFMKTKIRSLKTGSLLDVSFRAQEKVEEAYVDKVNMTYSYKEGSLYYFLDDAYEQIPVEAQVLSEIADYLKEEQECVIWYHDKEIIRIVLPESVVLEVVETEPGVKGDTASSATKPGKLETGLTIQMPLFINEGDMVKVDTRNGKYMERVFSA